ncbi:Crp/Fnr family transcriptional regulator [Chitinophaga sp. MM2321]|uniref:Crp/Fnr family transcriptional regulator n=1 Tax=Chitinophaga sp. MM2321 TaxID=3137178 RepID=UPI0032D5790A
MPENIHTEKLREKVSGISSLSEESFTLLLQHGKIKQWPKGALLLKEGAKCSEIYFIEKGAIKAFQDKDGKMINLCFYFEDTFVTNLKSLRSEAASAYNLQAMEPLQTYSFEKQNLLSLYTLSAEIELFGRSLLESLLIEQEEHANFFKLYSPEERYSYLLTHAPFFIQRIPVSQLASYLGITRESLSRIRKRIK